MLNILAGMISCYFELIAQKGQVRSTLNFGSIESELRDFIYIKTTEHQNPHRSTPHNSSYNFHFLTVCLLKRKKYYGRVNELRNIKTGWEAVELFISTPIMMRRMG